MVFETSTGEEGLEYKTKDSQAIVYVTSSVLFSLIKMLYWMCEKSGRPPTWPQLEHAICRNFGGSDELDTLSVFKGYIHIRGPPDLQSVPDKVSYEW